MAFFEPSPATTEPQFRYPEPAPWTRPPELTIAGIVPMNRVLARTEQGVVVMTEARAYRAGCSFEIVAAVRSPATQAARSQIWNAMFGLREDDGGPLPPELLRFGVQFGDARSATTLRRVPHTVQDGVPAPEPPVLYCRPLRGGESGPAWIEIHMALWLWPLPPAEDFELVLEYPLIGVTETRVWVEGSALTAAAAASSPLVDDGD